jgi:hypothetical protein
MVIGGIGLAHLQKYVFVKRESSNEQNSVPHRFILPAG